MILVDTSVWIDYFRGTDSVHRHALHNLIEEEEDICLADIIMAEILQGIRSDKQFVSARDYLLDFPIYSLEGIDSYVSVAQIYRLCRKKGITIRGITDCLIVQIAIENGLILLHKDRDFDSIAGIVKDLEVFPRL